MVLENIIKNARKGAIALGLLATLTLSPILLNSCESFGGSVWALDIAEIENNPNLTPQQKREMEELVRAAHRAAEEAEAAAAQQQQDQSQYNPPEQTQTQPQYSAPDNSELSQRINDLEKEQARRNALDQKEEKERQANLPQNQRHLFVCNNFKNGFKAWSYPQDYVGIKNTFNTDESLMFVDYDPLDKAGNLLKVDVYGPAGNLVLEDKDKIAYDGKSLETGIKEGSILASKGGLGDYKAVWSLNNGVIGEVDFTITSP
jgi:hypothetical protein